jgi:hypothetical protein
MERRRGEFLTGAAAEAGTYRVKGARWLRAEGGVRPRRGRDLKGRCLTFSEREEVALARAGGESMRAIARRLGRGPSTISRELQRNASGAGCYRATTAHALAYERAGRPKPAKLATNLVLRRKVEEDLRRRYSPEQIVGRLRRQFPDDPEMRVSPETIYQSLYVQSRGALRRDLTKCLRTGRALRRPCRQPAQRRNRIPDMINIAERPEADDRAVPGHWEGDLIIGKKCLVTQEGDARRGLGQRCLDLRLDLQVDVGREVAVPLVDQRTDVRAALTQNPRSNLDRVLSGEQQPCGARVHRASRARCSPDMVRAGLVGHRVTRGRLCVSVAPSSRRPR